MNTLVSLVVVILALVYFNWDTFDPESIRDKRVLITGASSGIGEHLAYQYSRLGARVFIAARRQNLLEKVATKCKQLGAKQVELVTSDLGDANNRTMVIAEARKRFGGLDHVILNHVNMSSGYWLGTKENMTTLMEDLNVNFVSFVDLASQALPMLIDSKGNLGVVSSIAGKFATAGFASYVTAKHAMQGFFAAFRQELLMRNTGVSVTTCVIGPVDTDLLKMTLEKKKEMANRVSGVFSLIATPEDTANVIMRGVAQRKYEIYYGKIAYVLVTIYNFFPEFIEGFMAKQSEGMFN